MILNNKTPKRVPLRIGKNLGFIDKVILTDGTILENTQVLGRSPIPSEEQLEAIFLQAANASVHIVGPATNEWSLYPTREAIDARLRML